MPRAAISPVNRTAAVQRLACYAALATLAAMGASAATAPPAPSIGIVAPGNALATINFTLPSANGAFADR